MPSRYPLSVGCVDHPRSGVLGRSIEQSPTTHTAEDSAMKPVFVEDGISFVWIQYNNLYLLAVTQRNSNAMLIVVFLYRLAEVRAGAGAAEGRDPRSVGQRSELGCFWGLPEPSSGDCLSGGRGLPLCGPIRRALVGALPPPWGSRPEAVHAWVVGEPPLSFKHKVELWGY